MAELEPEGSQNRQLDMQQTEQKVGMVRALWDRVIIAFRLFFDGRVPLLAKFIPLFTFVYWISPIDLLPALGFGPVGAVDDLTLIAATLMLFMQVAPPDVVKEHLREMGSPMFYSWQGGSEGSEGDSAYADGEVVDGEIVD